MNCLTVRFMARSRKRYLAPAAEFALQIRPEFFKDVGRHIDSDLHTELAGRMRGGAIVGIVSIGNGDRAVEFPAISE